MFTPRVCTPFGLPVFAQDVMQRPTIFIEDDLADDFEALIQARQYGNRSGAFATWSAESWARSGRAWIHDASASQR